MRRWSLFLVGLWIALVLLIAGMRQIGPRIDPPVVSAVQDATSLPVGFYEIHEGVPLGQVIAAWGPPVSIREGAIEPHVSLEVRFVTPRVTLFVKGAAADAGNCVLAQPDDEVETLAVWSSDQLPSAKVYYPQPQPWAGFTRYCFE